MIAYLLLLVTRWGRRPGGQAFFVSVVGISILGVSLGVGRAGLCALLGGACSAFSANLLATVVHEERLRGRGRLLEISGLAGPRLLATWAGLGFLASCSGSLVGALPLGVACFFSKVPVEVVGLALAFATCASFAASSGAALVALVVGRPGALVAANAAVLVVVWVSTTADVPSRLLTPVLWADAAMASGTLAVALAWPGLGRVVWR